MTPAIYNITIGKDTTYSEQFKFYSDRCRSQLMDLTGYEFKAQIKENPDDLNELVEFTIDTDNLSAGFIILYLPESVSINLPSGSYVWDLRVTSPDGLVDRWVKGAAKVESTVTR